MALFEGVSTLVGQLQHLTVGDGGLLERVMAWNASCASECGHGECYNGTCMCEIQFDGIHCDTPNVPYFASFAVIFFLVGAVCLAQLVLCVRAEFARMKTPSLWGACRVTIQKALYLLTFAAALLRGLYFAAPEHLGAKWVAGLLSAFYAVVLTGSSLIVCFWAEVFHLTDIRWERPRFLSKSLLGFMTFNIITYSLLVAEIILTVNETQQQKEFFAQVFNGCYAVLLFIVVVFFLIYGVEVYFKVRGKFVTDLSQSVNPSQLHQSRLGLISQAIMLMITVCFLFSDILGQFWKYKVTLVSRNVHDVVFRVVELGVALWFPCVLWNSIRPERLWVLNPKQILRKLEIEPSGPTFGPVEDSKLTAQHGSSASLLECWICYDCDITTNGPLIQPCDCRGSTSIVHHECLKKWLMECSETESLSALRCRVCDVSYSLETSGRAWLSRGFTSQHWLQTLCLIAVMSGSTAGCWAIMRFYRDAWIRTAVVGCVLIVYYVCLRFLGLSCLSASQRAQVSAVKILGRRLNSLSPNSSPIRRVHKSPLRAAASVPMTTSTGPSKALEDPSGQCLLLTPAGVEFAAARENGRRTRHRSQEAPM